MSSQFRCNRYGPIPGGGIQGRTVQQSLDGIASIIAGYGSTPATNQIDITKVRYLIAIPPTLARLLAELGYKKGSLKRWLWENARIRWDTLTPANQEQVKYYTEAGNLPGITLEDCKPGGTLPVFTLGDPQPIGDRLNVFVAGGEPGYSVIWRGGGTKNQHLTKLVHGATLTKSGRS